MKKLIMIMLPFLLLTACVDSLDDYNIDKKAASAVPPATLFTNGLKGLMDILTTPNVNSNNYRMFVQYWATTTYLDEPRYNMTSRTYSQGFATAVYRDALADFKEAKRLITLDESIVPAVKNNQLAIIEIMEVYSWLTLIETFGDVPYTEALDADNLLPTYDDDAAIFADLVVRIDGALGKLTPGTASLGTADVIYAGSAAKWVKFGNSLKLKMGMLIADKDEAKAKTMVQQATANLTLNMLTDNGDNAKFPYIASSPNNNPISANLNPQFSSREDFVMASTLIDDMNAKNDPRRSQWFTMVGGVYKGGRYGFSNAYASFSHAGTKIIAATLEGIFMDAAEINFLLAEAVERTFITGSAEAYYNAGVTASITYWGGSVTDATTYLAQPTVAYATAPGTYMQKIAAQKWVALFNRGWESWVEWRRMDAPALTPPTDVSIVNPLKIPVRMIYPVSDQTLNGDKWAEAAARMSGGDTPNEKLFWDVN